MVQEHTVQTNSDRTPAPVAPTVCLHCMMFFGNPAFENLCSQCFKTTKGTNLPAPSATTTEDAPKPTDNVAAETAPSAAVVPIVEKKAEVAVPTPAKEDTPATPVAAAQAAAEPAAKEEGEGKPKQKNPGRCWVSSCKKKVVFAKQVTNRCRCEYVFCDNHRQAEMHACEYDHKTAGRDRLGKSAGPACVADKVVRI